MNREKYLLGFKWSCGDEELHNNIIKKKYSELFPVISTNLQEAFEKYTTRYYVTLTWETLQVF